jgi:hypothetical protein
MELKKYQKAVIADLAEYLAFLPQMGAGGAFSAFWTAKNVPLQIGEHYRDTQERRQHHLVCGRYAVEAREYGEAARYRLQYANEIRGHRRGCLCPS